VQGRFFEAAGGKAAVDRDTFDGLILRHLPAAQRFAIRLTGRPDWAEEIVQSALLRAHRGWSTFGGKSAFRTWLFQIIVNAFRDDLDRRAVRETDPLPADMPDRPGRDPASIAETAELGRLVADAVSGLPLRQREVMVLHTYEQLTDAEIAVVLEMNPQNVRTTLHLARERVRQLLRPFLSDEHAAK
jgi:RNA polymerase sigma-70 factor (ECF subfamily)